MFKKIRIEFYKTRGGGSKAVYKLYKKTGYLVSDWLPYSGPFERVRLVTCRLTCNYPTKEFHH